MVRVLSVDARDTSTHRPLARRSVLGAAAAGAGWVLAGCGKSRGQAAADPGGITLTDQRGKKLHLPHPARRVVAIVMPAASMLIAIDSGSDHLVGLHPSAAEALREGILGRMFPAAKKIPSGIVSQDFAPNVESIVALNPDLVIQWGDKGAGITAPLEAAGLTVMGLNYGTQQDLETWIRLFGAALGKSPRADSMITRMHEVMQKIRARPAAAKPKILYFNHLQGGLEIGGKGAYNDFFTDLVGGVNPASSLPGLTTVNSEQVLAWDPDIMLLGNFDDTTPQDVFDRPVWKDVSAVRHRRVYKVPLGGYRWDPPCQESTLMWRWLWMLATGEHFDLRQQIVREYQYLYDYSPSAGQIDGILQAAANRHSAGYRRFHDR